jgi:hypothetical protein
MGLSIHYKGNLRNKASLSSLMEEVKDIVKVHQWPFETYDSEFPLHRFGKKKHSNAIYGIRFTPPECETVSLCFLSNGKLVSFWSWHLFIKSLGKDHTLLEGGVSVKTHYAGETIHKMIIHLLDHLSKKYFRHFTMMDEGQYWETRDEKLLRQNFAALNGLIKSMGTAIQENPMNINEPFGKYFERLIREIHTRNKLKE